uniref:Putative SKP1/BTB/POZ domain, NPH3 domain protein n=1 Tax=Helianthus annuus TaxID=4232 RepID=A0A251T5G3_HELAN
MKFMKLGSRPDTFYNSESVRSVSSEVSSDLVVQVNGTRYLLHKFPLLSKCLRLQKLCSESPESTQHQIIQLPDFPGGTESFELCAKFCYGITITLSAYNIVSARCAAEYLQMTEEVEKGNLVYKLDVFLNSCILNGWKDSIITLQTTKAFQLWSEDLGITSRCIEAIAAKVLSNPLKVSLSHSYSRRGRDRDDISVNGSKTNTSKGWWAEDLSELGIDLYWRTMIALKSGGKVPANLVGDALRIYASKWLPNISRNPENGETTTNSSSKSRLLLESVISLLPTERASVSCSFLLKLLKAANILRASSSSKSELARRIGIQLDEATVSDLLIPSTSNDMTYDVEGRFERHRRSRSANNGDFELQESRRSSTSSHSSKIKVAKLVDGYLKEIGKDVNLPLSKFTALAEAIPDFARLDHDDLYRAIDIYLRKRLCRTLDCKKLSMEVCMHAAQNELLPLRVVVQVLFFEQARAAMAGGQLTDLPSNIKALLAAQDDASRPPGSLSTNRSMVQPEDQWSVSGLKSPSSNISTLRMKLAENDDLDENFHDGISKTHSSKVKQLCSLPTRPKRMFSKLWSTNNRSASEKS